MLRLAILISLSPILLISGLIRTSDDIAGFEGNWLDYDKPITPLNTLKGERDGAKNPLWVLRLGGADFEDLKLKRGGAWEEKDFEEAVAPLIARLGRRKNKIVKDDSRKQLKDEKDSHDANLDKQLKNEIMGIVNKFVLSTHKEPDSYLSDSETDEEPSLALYFKGPYTSLIVKYGRNQWHYFIGPTSPLPVWFYQPFPDGDEHAVPSDVVTDFFKALVHLLQMFLSFPV